jgi:hypothetical protein
MRRIRIKVSRPRADLLHELDLRTPSGRLLNY